MSRQVIGTLASVGLLGLSLLAMSTAAHAADPTDTLSKDHVTARLVSDVSAVAPGETIRLGVEFKMTPHWHIYWRHSGASGIPTKIDFTGPDGAAFEEMQWPTPKRIGNYTDPAGVTYGYEDKVILFSDVVVPADLVEGSSATFDAKVGWLVCYVNCINGRGNLRLTLPVRADDKADRLSGDAEAIAAFAALVPKRDSALRVTSTLRDSAGVAPGASFIVDVMIEGEAASTLTAHGDVASSFFPDPAKGLRVTDVKVKTAAGNQLALEIYGGASATAKQLGARFDGVLQFLLNAKPHAIEAQIAVPRVQAAAAPVETAGVVVAPSMGISKAGVARTAEEICASVPAFVPNKNQTEGLASVWLALLFGFIGGLILNVMPCVLPVLSLKVMSLVEQSRDSPQTLRRHGLAYTGGVLTSFLILGLIMLGLQVTNIGFQLQSPVFIAIFVAVLVAFALSLFGVFEIALPGVNKLDQKVANSHGYSSSFNYGIFAVLLGTPCTAPFLGPAVTFATAQPPAIMLSILAAVGLGLAFPFLLIAFFPQWQRILPKPGPWLITFKKAMGFLLIGTAVFFINTFLAQVTHGAFIGYLVFLTILSLALWVYGHWAGPIRIPRTRGIATVVALALIVGSAFTFVSTEAPPVREGTITAGGMNWHDFRQNNPNDAALKGRSVFVDFTAEWCSTCKVNEANAIYTDEVREAAEVLGIVMIQGDYTREDAEISKWLTRFQEPSVPLYVVLPAGNPDGAMKLPTFPLSSDDVIGAMCAARPDAATATL
ncbi:MAG: thiol:disulfide interchange protein/DsbC/DsbD-like thiol-disulfide interchange protein [Myxococcota bacterium]|jgi:thiol:disulfide interchange protein/DsbC/DsbD-like thiol-disulfide interchange protein